MKKKFLTALFTAILFIILSVTAFASYNKGDINNDGKVSPADARLTLRYTASLEKLSEAQIAAADVDGKKGVTPADARLILRVSAGLDSFTSLEELNAMLIEPGVLNVAVCADNPPFCYIENGTLKGVDVDVAEKIAKSYGLELKLHNMAYDELVNSVKNNECDIALIKNYNSADNSIYSIKYNNITLNIYAGYVYDINSIEDLKSKKIGVIEGSVADKILSIDVKNGKLGNAQIFRYKRHKDATAAMRDESIFVFVGDSDFRCSLCQASLYPIDYTNDNYDIISTTEKSQLVININDRLTENTMSAILNKHFSKAVSDASIKCNVSNLVLKKGSTAIIELEYETSYCSDTIWAEPIGVETTMDYVDGKAICIVKVPNYASSGKIVFNLNQNPEVTHTVNITVSQSGASNYKFGNTDYCPDFGAFTGIMPDSISYSSELDAVTCYYSTSDLYYARYTDSAVYENYLKLIEKQGFIPTYYETDNYTYYTLYFVNEELEEAIAYTEHYSYSDTYLYITDISITSTYPF